MFGVGDEPDYRFTLANERTFLAWIRTGLALGAAGLAVDVFQPGLPALVVQCLAVGLSLLGVSSAVCGLVRWGASERAMRLGRPLPGHASTFVAMSTCSLAGVALVLVPALVR